MEVILNGWVVGFVIVCLVLSSWILLREANKDMKSICEGWPESDEGEDECGI
jgi:hypothetical protein